MSAGGETVNPTYYQVVGGSTGHLEAVRVLYDDDVISYEELLGYFWRNVNPLQGNGQFCDTGNGGSYLSAIFYDTEAEQQAAQASLDAIEAERPEWKGTVETAIRPLGVFYIAEPNHQDYYITNPFLYNRYKTGCRRVATLKDVWGEEAYDAYHPDVTAASTLDGALCSSSDEPPPPSSVTGGSSTATTVTGGSSSSVTGGSSSSSAPPSGESSNDSSFTGGSSAAPPPPDESSSAGRAASCYAAFLAAASVALLMLPVAAI